jgi:hypothetical protein
MKPEDIDDLFRQQLDGHATPPPADLWARLALPATPAPEAEPLDEVFRAGLAAHTTPPRRELWERLEDEHLRPQPRRRRVVAWWQYSAAAVLLLMLLAGGAGLWRSGFGGSASGELATSDSKAGRSQKQIGQPALDAGEVANELIGKNQKITTPITRQTDNVLASTPDANSEKNQQNISGQATAPRPSTSSTPIATTTRPRRAAATDRDFGSHRPQRGQQPDAASGQLATTGRRTPAGQPLSPTRVAPTPMEVPAPRDTTPTLAVARPTPAATPEIIEVEVRRGGAPTPAAPVVVAQADATPTPARRPRLRLGGLLRQADHLVHGESVNLAEATGLPETVTVQAHLGSRLLSRTIQL